MGRVAQAVKPRRLTDELRREHETFRAIIVPALGPRTRIVADSEGWPMAPGRYGRLEWRGREAAGPFTGTARLTAYTGRVHMIRKLRAIPGLVPSQVGDREAAFSLAAEPAEAIRAVAQLLHTRVRRAPETGRSPEALAAVRPR